MTEILKIAGFLILAYLLGSIPFGYIISKWKGIDDIRETGSGSTGGTNVSRKLGIKWGVVVGFLDGLKSFLPMFFARQEFGIGWVIFLIIILAVLGHIYPVWLKFRGGKGVATAIGGLILILPVNFIIVIAIVWFLVFFSTRYVSFASLMMFFFLPVALYFSYFSIWYFLFGFLIFLIIAWAHRENIKKLIKEEESQYKLPKIRLKFPKKRIE